MRLRIAPLGVPEPGKAGGGAEFPQARFQGTGNVQGCTQMAFDFRWRSALDLEHLGVKPMDLSAHVVLAVLLGVSLRGLDVTERRLGPTGE